MNSEGVDYDWCPTGCCHIAKPLNQYQIYYSLMVAQSSVDGNIDVVRLHRNMRRHCAVEGRNSLRSLYLIS